LCDEFGLEEHDYEIYGMMRRSANPNLKNIEKIKNHPRFNLQFLDLGDSASIDTAVKEIQPDYFINFAANSFVGISWKMPEQVMDVNALGVLRCLEAIRKFKPDCRFYSAGSSEEWGNVDYSPQDIAHPIKPRSPYGASKAAARHLVKVYRESYGLYAVHGILLNHEGTKRGEEFVTRKISKGVARIKNSIDNNQAVAPIELGNLDAKRDWSDSIDFVEGVWLMLNQNSPKDYILSSGEAHSIREFVEKAFAVAGINGFWHGEGLNEVFKTDQQTLVKINPEFYRPAEVDLLLGDSTPIREELGWKPKILFDNLVESMVLYDIDNYA
jgi:GDPmannose 4,6-dehydratase